ncbi:hypothetical protein [Siphonobacter sp. SORGH_AS_1065]|uniref:DUF6992 family protein n=1 Tax=Siphonobacter sp. SORGH_AS_1065 TaxID=3041795 RepID=UPI0027880FE7|nr:hypothetical protein [Siphonobacter sp. SORGH_AS_1065]MDQ1085788.1 hypothetical protein [Siphonobacter sp. SORGH_AS_1065]
MKKLLSLLVLCLGTPRQGLAQTSNEFDQNRIALTRKGLYVLGGWAVGNLAYSGSKLAQSSGEAKAFHQMNMGWGAVNLLLAGIGTLTSSPRPRTPYEVLQQQEKFEKIFLVNTALDVAYVAGGAYLNEKGKNQENARNQGFGKSVMLQGAFLFAFDGLMYLVHRQHFRKHEHLWKTLRPADEGVGVNMSF